MALFEKLFEINIKHAYYRDDISADFKIVPAEETRQLLQDHGLLFRSTSSGFAVLAEVDPAENSKLKSHPIGPARYRFLLKLKKPEFLNYTDLSFYQTGEKIFYFNNLDTNIQQIDSDEDGSPDKTIKYIHPQKKVRDDDKITFKTKNYSYGITGNTGTKTARLEFLDLDIKDEQQIKNEMRQVQFDLSNYPDGRAKLVVGGSKKETFYATGRRNMAGIFGIIEIFQNKTLQQQNPQYCLIDSEGKLQSPVFTLFFDNRKTYWKYLVFDRTEPELKNPEITGKRNGADYKFNNITPADSNNPMIFKSGDKLPLREFPRDGKEDVKSLKLKKANNNNDKKTVMNLPHPGIKMLKKEENGDKDYYSEVFIYI